MLWKGITALVIALVLGYFVKQWSTKSTVTTPFTGITPQRGIFGTDATPVAGAT